MLGKRTDLPDHNRSTSRAEASSGTAPERVASATGPTEPGTGKWTGATDTSQPSGTFSPRLPPKPTALLEEPRVGESASATAAREAEDLRRAIELSREESVRSRTGSVAASQQSRSSNDRASRLASRQSGGSFDGLLANLSEAQKSLLQELVEINGQDSYDSLTAGIGKLKQDEFLVLPHGFTIPDVRPGDVGKPIAHVRIPISDWADIYALNKAVAPPGSDAMIFGLLRLEAVKCGWLVGGLLREVTFGVPPDDALIQLVDDMRTLKDKAADIKTASFILPMAAEHTFRTMGHHFITTDSSNYVQRYTDTFRACLYPQIAGMLPPPVLYHTALHWVGPGRVRSVVEAQATTQAIPDAIKIRMNAAPAGTAILTTTSAIVDAMAAVNLDQAFEKYGNFGLQTIRDVTARVKASPCKYHKAYFAYGISRASNAELNQLEDGKKAAERFAPYAQAFIDTYMKEAALGKAKAIKKHADNNPVQYRRSITLFRAIMRAKVTSVEDLIRTQLSTVRTGDEDDQ